jgi:hypothetical protein
VPSRHDVFPLSTAVGYVPGHDGATELTGAGRINGVAADLNAFITLGDRGPELYHGRLALRDEDATRGLLVGDLVSETRGLSRGATFSWRAARNRTPAVAFNVTNVSVETVGNPAPVRVSVSTFLLLTSVRISVKADAPAFTPPTPSPSIPASNVRWTVSNSSGGTGSNGTVSSAAWTQLFQTGGLVSGGGRVDVTSRLGAPGGGIRAGSHTLTIRYKVEAS